LLHIINKSPFTKNSLDSAIRLAQKGDPILLIEDAVLGVNKSGNIAAKLTAAMADHKVYALSADVKARGIDNVLDGVIITDYAGFVDLVVEHRPMSWL